jgi:hypothetical protein
MTAGDRTGVISNAVDYAAVDADMVARLETGLAR